MNFHEAATESPLFSTDSSPDAPPEGERWSSWDGANRTQIAGILDKAAQSTDEAQRKTLWKQALDIVAEEAPLYPILHTKVVTAFDKTKLDGFAAAPTTGLYFLDSSRKG